MEHAAVERRATARAPTPRADAFVRAWLRSGAEIRLLDLSAGGAQIESARRLLPGARIDLQVQTAAGRFVLTGRLIRAEVSALSPNAVHYRAGLAFEPASAASAASLARFLQGSGYPARPATMRSGAAAGPAKQPPRGAAPDGTSFGSGKPLSRVLG
jgi:hypothetical protein